MSSNWARTPIASRNQIDSSFSDGYGSNHSRELVGHSSEEAEFRSPIDLTSRTPTHIRFAETESNQLAEVPMPSRHLGDSDSQLR